MWKWINRVLVTLLVLILGWRIGNWAERHGHTLPAPAPSNAFNQLVTAAGMVKARKEDFGDMGPEQLQRFVEENRPGLELAAAALTNECSVAPQATGAWDARHDASLSRLRGLAVAMGLQAKSEMLQHRTNEAVRCEMATLRLAEAIGHGGLVVDGITALTTELVGVGIIQSQVTVLDAASCRELATGLENYLGRLEPPEKTFATEKEWMRLRFGLLDVAGGWIRSDANRASQQKYRERSAEIHARTAYLMVRLAARAFELENGQSAAKVAELVPKYLKAIPRDSATGNDITEIPAAPH